MLIRPSRFRRRLVLFVSVTTILSTLYWRQVWRAPMRWNSSKPVDCPRLGFSTKPLPLTALASFPCSGNSWTRHLLQLSTGIYTGSVSHEGFMIRHGYKGQGVANGSVIAIKTHGQKPNKKRVDEPQYDRVILLMRNPYESRLSYFHLKRAKSHINITSMEKFCKYYKNFTISDEWRNFYIGWLKSFKGEMILLFYDDLLRDTEEQLKRLLTFLGFPTDKIECALNNPEGVAHRVKKLPITNMESRRDIQLTNLRVEEVANAIRKRWPNSGDSVLKWQKSANVSQSESEFEEKCKNYRNLTTSSPRKKMAL